MFLCSLKYYVYLATCSCQTVGISCEACCCSNPSRMRLWWLWRQHGHSLGFRTDLRCIPCASVSLRFSHLVEYFSSLLLLVWHVLCFFCLSPQEENEGVHSNRLYHGSVMINRTNSTLTPLSISRGAITALWDVFACTDRLVLLTLCVFICNVQKMQLLSPLTRLCVCVPARRCM